MDNEMFSMVLDTLKKIEKKDSVREQIRDGSEGRFSGRSHPPYAWA